MIRLTAPRRGLDSFGSGAYGASRGSRTHNGIDFSAQPESLVHSLTAGVVTKVGYPYADDLSFRYVQITGNDHYDIRYFYVEPTVAEGDVVGVDGVIGSVQDLDGRYTSITPHIHLEIRHDGHYINPDEYFTPS